MTRQRAGEQQMKNKKNEPSFLYTRTQLFLSNSQVLDQFYNFLMSQIQFIYRKTALAMYTHQSIYLCQPFISIIHYKLLLNSQLWNETFHQHREITINEFRWEFQVHVHCKCTQHVVLFFGWYLHGSLKLLIVCTEIKI